MLGSSVTTVDRDTVGVTFLSSHKKFDDPLYKLAKLYNMPSTYVGADNKEHEISANSIKRVLSIFGVNCGSDAQISDEINAKEASVWLKPILPTVIEIQGYGSEVDLYLPANVAKDISKIDFQIRLESGLSSDILSGLRDDILHSIQDKVLHVANFIEIQNISECIEVRVIDDIQYEHRTFKLSRRLPIGYHKIILKYNDFCHESHLIVTPISAKIPDSKSYGFMSQFYSMRSENSWGIGDFENLRCLALELKMRTGADFLLINPIHADHPSLSQTNSPYMPMSRRWLNPIYIRPDSILEYIDLEGSENHNIFKMVSLAANMAKEMNKDSSLISRNTVWSLKKQALRLIFEFGNLSEARKNKFEKFKKDGGIALTKFATWCSLVDEYSFGGNFQNLKYDSSVITKHIEAHEHDVEFYRWMQWIAQSQMQDVQGTFTETSAKIGLVCDLAVGVNLQSADVWSNPDAYLGKLSLGAPPDVYNQKGQDWSLAPLNPEHLENTGYQEFRDIVRGIMKNCGALRIDHILGLFRFWLVPRNDRLSPQDGVYVEYNHDALIGILALESHRQNCIVIGEDMGVIPPGAFEYMKARGILGTSVLWFERERDGSIKDIKKMRELCLTTVTTHDIPPTLGFIEGEHIRLRNELDLLTTDVKNVISKHNKDLDILRKYLVNNGYLEPNNLNNDVELSIALQRTLFDAPSLLSAFSFTDFVGEYRAQNQPGTNEEYPNWLLPLEDMDGNLVLNENLFENSLFKRFSESIKQINDVYSKGEINAI